jgi:hypothetical protein
MSIDLSISTLFERAFGYKSAAFEPKVKPVRGIVAGKRTETASALGSPYYAKADGREYYLPVKISYGEGNEGRLNTFNLPYPVVSIRSSKTFVDTALTERNGTVTELINIRGYEITIRGLMINTLANELPEFQMALLRDLYEQNKPISINSVKTDIFLLRTSRKGSDKVSIRDIDFPEISGVKNVQPYFLQMISEEPFNLIDIS